VVDTHTFFDKMYHKKFEFDTLTKWDKRKKLEVQSPTKTATFSTLNMWDGMISGTECNLMDVAQETQCNCILMGQTATPWEYGCFW
jgi:hypothetical protein